MVQTDNIRRYGCNREAVAAALELCRLYHRDAWFTGELAWLWDNMPPAVAWTDVERPMAEDLFDFAGQDDRRLPGRGIQDYEQYYQQHWKNALKWLGSDDPWVRRIDDVAVEFGLAMAPWGRGVIADMA
jgi:hypothetical protein